MKANRRISIKDYPYLEAEDINQALKYCAWRAEEVEMIF